jgi:hypothetical protein
MMADAIIQCEKKHPIAKQNSEICISDIGEMGSDDDFFDQGLNDTIRCHKYYNNSDSGQFQTLSPKSGNQLSVRKQNAQFTSKRALS